MENNLDPRLHFVVATAIIARKRELSRGEQGRTIKPSFGPAQDVVRGTPEFLIAKRAPHEKAFPNKWTVPGGKLVRSEYEHLPKRPYVPGQKPSDAPQWYGMMDWLVKKEVKEEVNVEVGDIKYLTDLVFIRPDGFPVVTFSFWCMYASGDVKLCKDLTEYAWVTAEEAKKYDLIEGIWEEIRDVNKLLTDK